MLKITENCRILFLGAHADDIELGCGGFISNIIRKQIDQNLLRLEIISNNLVNHAGDVVAIRDLKEQEEAFKVLGIEQKSWSIRSVSGGQIFPENRQAILDFLYKIKHDFNPNLIFTTSQNDVHQDHRTLNWCTQKAFNRMPILSYNSTNSSRKAVYNLFFSFDEEDLIAKTKAVGCYNSMLSKDLSRVDYFDEKVIKSDAVMNGLRCSSKYAEAFEAENLTFDF